MTNKLPNFLEYNHQKIVCFVTRHQIVYNNVISVFINNDMKGRLTYFFLYLANNKKNVVFDILFIFYFEVHIKIKLVNAINIRIINNDNFITHIDRSIHIFSLTRDKLGQNNSRTSFFFL